MNERNARIRRHVGKKTREELVEERLEREREGEKGDQTQIFNLVRSE